MNELSECEKGEREQRRKWFTSTPLIPAKILIEFVVKIERSDM